MRFIHPIHNAEYVVVPTDWEASGQAIGGRQRLRVVRGLTAKFAGGVFDSELAQKRMRWSDEDRQVVEQYLQEHVDFGNHLFLAPTAEEIAAAAADPGRAVEGCRAGKIEGGKLIPCGRGTIGDTGYCDAHLRLLMDGQDVQSFADPTALPAEAPERTYGPSGDAEAVEVPEGEPVMAADDDAPMIPAPHSRQRGPVAKSPAAKRPQRRPEKAAV